MLKKRLLEIVESEKKQPVFSLATLLLAGAYIYGALVLLRRKCYEKDLLPTYNLPCPVISVGNITAGGTGKTPLVIHLAELIKKMGRKVVILSRGYKGEASKHSAVVSDGRSIIISEHQSGDEPYLMATLLEDVPVVVGKDRWMAGKMAFDRFRPDIILLDDAFQHLRLKRDLNLLLMDAQKPLGNSYLLPRGRLREPASSLSTADAIIFTRSNTGADNGLSTIAHMNYRKPVFCSEHISIVRGIAPAGPALPPLKELSCSDLNLKDKNVFAFSGLADNEAFFNTLASFGWTVQGTMAFEDHHPFNKDDIKHLVQAAVAAGADYLVTTDKDYVRFSYNTCLTIDVIVLGVKIHFKADSHSWNRFIFEQLECFND